MAGGTASGKTEFARSYLTHSNQLVYDGTLKSFDGLKVKLDKIKRYTKIVPKLKIVFIIPNSIEQSFEVFRARERKMHDSVFFDTHMKSALTISKILSETNFRVEIYSSELDREIQKLNYKRLSTAPRSRVAKYLTQYSEMIFLTGNILL